MCVEWSFILSESDFSTMEVNLALKVLKIHPVAPSTLSPNFYGFNADFLDLFIGFGSVQISLSHFHACSSFVLSELRGVSYFPLFSFISVHLHLRLVYLFRARTVSSGSINQLICLWRQLCEFFC